MKNQISRLIELGYEPLQINSENRFTWAGSYKMDTQNIAESATKINSLACHDRTSGNANLYEGEVILKFFKPLFERGSSGSGGWNTTIAVYLILTGNRKNHVIYHEDGYGGGLRNFTKYGEKSDVLYSNEFSEEEILALKSSLKFCLNFDNKIISEFGGIPSEYNDGRNYAGKFEFFKCIAYRLEIKANTVCNPCIYENWFGGLFSLNGENIIFIPISEHKNINANIQKIKSININTTYDLQVYLRNFIKNKIAVETYGINSCLFPLKIE